MMEMEMDEEEAGESPRAEQESVSARQPDPELTQDAARNVQEEMREEDVDEGGTGSAPEQLLSPEKAEAMSTVHQFDLRQGHASPSEDGQAAGTYDPSSGMTTNSPAVAPDGDQMINPHLSELSPRDDGEPRATAELVLPNMLGSPAQLEEEEPAPNRLDMSEEVAGERVGRAQVPLVAVPQQDVLDQPPREDASLLPGALTSTELSNDNHDESRHVESMPTASQPAKAEQQAGDGSFESALFDVATGKEREPMGGAGELGAEEGDSDAAAYWQRQRVRMYKIQELKQRLQTAEIQPYAEEMAEEAFEAEAITVGSVSAEVLQEQHKAVNREREREAKEAQRLHRRRQDILARQEEEALREVRREEEEAAAKSRGLHEERLARDHTRARGVRNAFRAAQETLISSLRRRGAALKQKFGVLAVDHGNRSHLLAQQRHWKLSAALAYAPHPVKVRIDTVRVLRDKVQRGHCVIVATLLDRMGGNPLTFPGAGERYRSRTRPVAHSGRYFDLDLLVSEHLFLLCPPERKLLGSMCVLFELYQCKSRLQPIDHAIGWGVFPLVTCAFKMVSGKFKAPLLRGTYDPEIKLYQDFEERMRKDLDTWLGNIYFKVSGMSRYVHQEREYALRMDYTSDLLGIANPKRVDLDEIKVEALKAEADGPGAEPDAEGGREEREGGGMASRLASGAGGVGEEEVRRGSQQSQRSGASMASRGRAEADPGAAKQSARQRELLAEATKSKRGSGSGSDARKKGGGGGEVEWEKVFEAEKIKMETGIDPEGDGLSDLSDSEEDSETEDWERKGMVTTKLSRKVMARTGAGAVLRVHGGESSEEEEEDGSAVLEAEEQAPRPIDEGKAKFEEEEDRELGRLRLEGKPIVGMGGGEEREASVSGAAMGYGDAGGKGVGLTKLGKGGDEKKKSGSTVMDMFGSGIMSSGMAAGEKENVQKQLQNMNKGKLNASFKLDLWNPGVQIVKYDKRLAAYVQTIGGGKADRVASTQSLFLLWEVLFDLGLSEPRSWTFIISLLLLFVCWAIRVQIHYIAGFAFLELVNRPIYDLGINWYRWSIRYSPVATTTTSEVGMLCAGPVTVFVVWLSVAFLLSLVDRLMRVDRLTYRVVGMLGVLSTLDWPLVMLVDVASWEFFRCRPASDPDPITQRALLKSAAESCTAESYRLWFYFEMNEGNGSIAPVFVIIVYLGLLAVFGVMLYTYFLNIHEGGRILDLYRRLTSKEGALFLPHDCELSPSELTEVLHKCERWRGRNGGYRKMMVTELHLDYVGDDGEVVGGDKSLTHIAVYTVPRVPGENKKGPKQLHRHFVRLQDGALVELIGDEVQYMVSRSVMTAVEKTVSETLGDGGEFIRKSKEAAAMAAKAIRSKSARNLKSGGSFSSKNFTSNFNSVVGFGSTKAS